ncbi:MAG: hypothetical protein A2381_06075 [Bdellovibrionales bacterium RIFOXYB1_FULL_37_110]|nr:MAG: hypothetical protein A2417_04960 [Bdellovibrionales bacterium RIFOXYC1_FULL_37_79]OFZ59385.1 MAG: hypothetical protein A2381_06075 [Bdellovibrionales bacterium RIFOXYB1_FULL_37_110]OFZ61945.1 MAG: hypothetical protein A2577_17960 [Bdellovibrionales bacterium RIFOXYD1_FULL_36_51]
MKKINKSYLLFILVFVYSCSSSSLNSNRNLASVEDQLGRRKISSDYQFPKDTNKVKVAFLDADSTLRVSKSGQVSANSSDDVFILPCVGKRLKALNKAGYLIAIVSNQGGVPSMVSYQDADGALKMTVDLIKNEGGIVHYYDFAEFKDEDRKPGIGMALRLENMLKEFSYEVDKQNSFMVGDSAYKKGVDTRPDGKAGTHFSNSDRLFAENYFKEFLNAPAPYNFEEAAVFFGWNQNGIDVFQTDSVTGKKGIEFVQEYMQKFGLYDSCPAPVSKLVP